MKSNARSSSEVNVFTIDCKDIILREYLIDDLDVFHSLTWQPEIYEYKNRERLVRSTFFVGEAMTAS
jgi:hypothetical protein